MNVPETEIEETLPVGGSPAPEAPEPETPDETETANEQTEESAIEIDGKTFTNEREALTYARGQTEALRKERELAEAYKAGMQDAVSVRDGTGITSETPAEPDNWEENFYANPKEAFQKERERIKAEVRAELSQQTAEEQHWATFTARHPDLDHVKDDVYATLTRERDTVTAIAATKGPEAAMDYLAQRTRTKFEEYMEKKKPTKQLSNGKAGPTPGGQTNVTPKPQTKKPLSMFDQMRTLRESRRKKA